MGFDLKVSSLPARLRFPKPMNDEELLRFSARNADLRMEREPDGEILVMAPASSETGAIEHDVGLQLVQWALADGRGKVFGPSTGFSLRDGTVRMPDAAWVSYRRWNALTPGQRSSYAPICPEFVIEIRSRSDRLPPLQMRMETWISNGVELAWLIDPRKSEVTVYRPSGDPEVYYGPSSVKGTGPVNGFELIMD